MSKRCLKCGYERKETEIAPDYECPSCGAVYAKVEKLIKKKEQETINLQKNDSLKKSKTRRYLLITLILSVTITSYVLVIYFKSHDEIQDTNLVAKSVNNPIDATRNITLKEEREQILSKYNSPAGALVSNCGLGRTIGVCKELLESGIDANSINDYGNTALYYLSSKVELGIKQPIIVDLLRLLLKHGADPNLRADGGSGGTPLEDMFPYMGGRLFDTKFLALLLEGGADPNMPTTSQRKGYTVLGSAAKSGSLEAVRLLIKYGASDDAAIRASKESALIQAANYPKIVAYLINQGADVNYQPKEGLSALQSAAKYGNVKSLLVLLDSGSKTDFIYTLEGREYSVADLALEAFVDTAVMSDLFFRIKFKDLETLQKYDIEEETRKYKEDMESMTKRYPKTLKLLQENGCALKYLKPNGKGFKKLRNKYPTNQFAAAILNHYVKPNSRSISSCNTEKYISSTPYEIRWANDNPKGTPCYDAVQEVRKLGNHPEYECSSSIRKRWSRAVDRASNLGCQL